jgi:hypothetical protein
MPSLTNQGKPISAKAQTSTRSIDPNNPKTVKVKKHKLDGIRHFSMVP